MFKENSIAFRSENLNLLRQGRQVSSKSQSHPKIPPCWISTIFIGVLFLVTSPIYAIAIGSLLNIRRVISFYFIAPVFGCAFTLVHLTRNLGINWSETAKDDVPEYIFFFNTVSDLSILEVLSLSFRPIPGVLSAEPAYALWTYFMEIISGGNISIFLISYYFFVALLLCLVCYVTSPRHWLILLGFMFFVFLAIWGQSAHIYRFTIANALFMLGTSLYFNGQVRKAVWTFALAPLFHIGVGFYLFSFLCYFASEKVIQRRRRNNRPKIITVAQKSIIIVICLVGILFSPVILSAAASVLNFLGYTRINQYFAQEGLYSYLSLPRLIRAALYAGVLVAGFMFLKINRFSAFLGLTYLISLGFGLIFSQQYGLYSRLLEFSSINIALGVGLVVIQNFNQLLSSIIFSSVVFIRISVIYLLVNSNQPNVWEHLANGRILSPVNGIVNLATPTPTMLVQAKAYSR